MASFRLHNINSLLHRYHIPFLFAAINYWFPWNARSLNGYSLLFDNKIRFVFTMQPKE